MKNLTQIKSDYNLAISNNLCIHAITGEAPETKGCANNYDCGSCPFDQMLDDMGAHNTVKTTARVVRAA